MHNGWVALGTLVLIPVASAIGASLGFRKGAKDHGVSASDAADFINKSAELASNDPAFAEKFAAAHEAALKRAVKALGGK